MIGRIEGIYRKENNGSDLWESNEFFTKEGSLRFIDGKIHKLSFSIWPSRFWSEVKDYSVHLCYSCRKKK